MMRSRSRAVAVAAALGFAASCWFGTSGALAQDYPARPIRVIATSSAGGTSDIFMRALGDELQKSLGQPIVLENRKRARRVASFIKKDRILAEQIVKEAGLEPQ
jgi:tripartite-type tricarboxylate transporter receptor subunit TctC